jgi:hypothetical protein
MKLSVVVVVRNDNYGLYLQDRLTCFFKSIQECPFDLELVLVEWNPPKENKSFFEEFESILPTNKIIKIITVPNEIHSKLPNSNHFPVFEYIGKNCGGRHSSGEYILFTNPDNIITPNLWVETFNTLSPERFLRASRCDIFYNSDIDYNKYSLDEIILNSTIKNKYNYVEGLFGEASGDFLCIRAEDFYRVKGYDEGFTYSHFDSAFLNKLSYHQINQIVLNNSTYHIDHARPNLEKANSLNLMTGNVDHTYNDDWGLLNEQIKIQKYDNKM